MRELVAMVAVALLLGSCATDAAGPPPSASSAPRSPGVETSEPPAQRLREVKRIRTGVRPCGILAAEGRIWVSNFGEDTLVAIDPDSGRMSRPVPVGDQPCGLAAGAGSIWVENYGGHSVTRVDAETLRVQATYEVGLFPFDVAFAEGAAWVTDNGSHSVTRIDAATGRTTTIRTGGRPIGIAPAGGLVWVGLRERGIAAIDPATDEVVHRLRTDAGATWTAADEDTVWLDVGSEVWEVDGRTGDVRNTYPVGGRPADGSVHAGSAWVPDNGGEVYQLRDGEVTRWEIERAINPFVLVGHGRRLWTVDFQGTDVVALAVPRD